MQSQGVTPHSEVCNSSGLFPADVPADPDVHRGLSPRGSGRTHSSVWWLVARDGLLKATTCHFWYFTIFFLVPGDLGALNWVLLSEMCLLEETGVLC